MISNNICRDVYVCQSWTPCLHSSSFRVVKHLEKTIKGPFTNYSPSLPTSKPNPQNFIRAWNAFNFILNMYNFVYFLLWKVHKKTIGKTAWRQT